MSTLLSRTLGTCSVVLVAALGQENRISSAREKINGALQFGFPRHPDRILGDLLGLLKPWSARGDLSPSVIKAFRLPLKAFKGF